ncbi:MAG: Maf family nucleotide pyrophosphatase [Chloroflexota bacterium]|nr:Maf family nucleotide pyrophosphatase [Chloroflexota bacterium]
MTEAAQRAQAAGIAPGDRIELTLGELTPTGECTAMWDGEAVTVFGGIPGERVVAEIVRRRRDHVAARVIEVVEASPDRVESDCDYFWPCTGCQWRHVSYERQLDIKRERVETALRAAPELADIGVLPTMPSRSTSGYRNHARFTIGPGGTLGYVNHTTRRFLRVDRCDLMHPWINDALARLQERCAETTQLSVRYGVNTGEYLVQPRLVRQGIDIESGQKHYTEAMHGRRFRVASPSFFQVNTPTAEAMVELVGEQLRLQPTDLLVDAYAGVGVFARLLAERCARVIAIEESSAAVKDARVNAEDSPTVEFRLGKTEDVLSTLEEAPDALILDPPRAGCDRRALDAVLRLGPRRVAYVSCEPEALARDLAVLAAGGYRIEIVQPVDLFPHTHHIEAIAVLSRDNAGAPLTLASASPRRRELLQILGLDYNVAVSGVDETPGEGEDTPERLAESLALRKAKAIASERSSGLVLGADTVVALDGGVFGKPANAAEAEATLRALRGRTHTVITGVALVDAATGESASSYDATRVTMREFSDAEMAAYIATGNPMDKAGAYAAQDASFHPAAAIEGCWTNVIGLPVCRVRAMLRERGVDTPAGDEWGPADGCSGCAAIPERGWPLP